MRVLLLFLLTLLLGLMVFLKFEMDVARQVSNEVETEYFTEEYTINKVDSSGYYGESADGRSIYFKKEKVESSQKIKNGDDVILYFDKSGRIDGPVKIEKTE
ncbi:MULTISPECIES: hypothetical protein [Mesobacillus]|uniref:hypothetical protein n=1 Tax=Mesobacillus TaxID=2675231 RepID=UPI00177C2376|nr:MULTISPECIES: hypothetical protein [Mesobacillus]MCM3575172.1 hypothetical protein [Mesobacillus subterraneus]UYZ24224.1 hypothetical protein FOF60_12075 [Mesobacillus jeotgali]